MGNYLGNNIFWNVEIKMTLAKAIEAARESLKYISHLARRDERACSPNMRSVICTEEANEIRRICREKLAALPDKPMTKSQALELVKAVWKEMAFEAIKRGTILTAGEEAYICIEALNKANVLYVKED